MKINKNYQRGGILFGMMVVITVVGVMLVAYMGLVSQRARSVSRSQSWNTTVPIAESGIEEGMAHLNQTKGRNLATNGWTTAAANTFIKSYNMGWGRYSVRVSNTNAPPAETVGAVEATGFVKVAGALGEVSRRFRVTTRFRPQIEGIVAQSKVTLQDFAMADSYDSRVGPYNAGTARDKSFIGNNSTFADQMLLQGNAKIYGSVGTGSPSGVALTSPAEVGDKAHVDGSGTGLQSGHHDGNLSAPISSVLPPFTGIGLGLTAGAVGTTNYSYLLTGGNYKHTGSITMDGAAIRTMMVTRDSTLWITDTLTVKGTAKIFIAPGARLKLYMEKQFYCQETAEINVGGKPEQLSYYGLTSNAEFYMSGSARFVGTMYAPQAKMDISGDAQIYGGGSCGELVMKGNAKFHYDEALAASKEQPFLITSWSEL